MTDPVEGSDHLRCMDLENELYTTELIERTGTIPDFEFTKLIGSVGENLNPITDSPIYQAHRA